MKKSHIAFIAFFTMISGCVFAQQRGYYNAPYTRYEADLGTLAGSYTVSPTTYNQADIAFEASDRKAVNLKNGGSAEWNVAGNFNRLGIVIRYSIAGVTSHTQNLNANVQVYVGGELKATLTLNTKYSWEDLKNNGNSNNGGITNTNFRMRFDEARCRIDQNYPSGTTVKLVSQSNDLWIDFIEVENVPEPKTPAQQGANATFGGGDGLQSFINGNGGKTIFIPEGTHNVGSSLNIGSSNTKLVGAGMWYSQINFTQLSSNNGGVHWAASSGLDLKDLYLTTDNNSRNNAYKGIWGTTTNATVENVWIVHFECGVWLGKYGSEQANEAANVTFRHCRFRNNYADGINFCKGANNNLAEFCDFRNNGDDDMAVWPANNQQCYNNTFRYNTAEFCWRAASCSLYGGYGNKWQKIVVKDNWEVGIRTNGIFGGACFADGAQNEFSEIDVIGCGTRFNTYNNPDPAVDITSATGCNNVKNIKFSCINITNSKADALFIRKQGGGQISNVSFESITINGANLHGANANGWGTAAGVRFVDNPTLNNVQHCDITYSNIEGSNFVGSGWTEKTSGCAVCEQETNVAVTGVALANISVNVGANATLSPVISPSNATNQAVSYEIVSGNDKISLNGAVVTGAAAGAAQVRVTTADGNKTATCTVTVNQVTPEEPFDLIVTDISWTPANPQPNDQVVFTATVKNIGGQPAPNNLKLGVLFRIDGAVNYLANSNTFTWSDTHYGGLAAGATVQLTANGGDSGVNYWLAGASGNHTVDAYVNDGNAMPETNRANNILQKTIVISAPAGFDDMENSGKTVISCKNSIEIRGIEIGEAISVYNILGIKLFSQKAAQTPMIINNLQSGIYIVVIEGQNIAAKVVVR
ncbi:MAG: right-handed parallel beta-helix repeat-containing protein [Prevotellaceae bacterium]|jgi:hypothetical protein|nr:right-handed parallel beta-helix repeat-containing protein [Prevotellaceae bacterium]